jgi:hypothetical protein
MSETKGSILHKLGQTNGRGLNADTLDNVEGSQYARNDAANDFSHAVVIMSALPTTDPVVAGQLWNNLGVLNISAG